jgi:hypothetical protein
MKQTLTLFIFTLFVSALALASSTFTEANYSHIRQEGRVHIECDDGRNRDYNTFWCEGSYLSPSDAEHFVTTKRDDLHHVTLTTVNNRGSRTEDWRINSWTGKSIFSIPLWGGAGILALGTNNIHYSVETKTNEPLEQGDFEVEVDQPPTRECREIWVRSSNTIDCRSPGYACSELSYPRNECRP